MESSQEKGGILGLVVKGVRWGVARLDRAMSLGPEKVPLDEINEQTVAGLILRSLGNTIGERLGQGSRWDTPFSVVDVLKQMGYSPSEIGANAREEFPGEYEATRRALDTLVQGEGLERFQLGKPDPYQETIHYQVVGENVLRDIAYLVPKR